MVCGQSFKNEHFANKHYDSTGHYPKDILDKEKAKGEGLQGYIRKKIIKDRMKK